jgi:hypothetical protein
MNVFDGLPAVFVRVFGEPVDYTPAGGVTKRIRAIWNETPLSVLLGNEAVDGSKTELSVWETDIAAPKEGDAAVRVKNGKRMVLSTPIMPDGKGMIVCNLTD